MNRSSRNFRMIRELHQTHVVMMDGAALDAYRSRILNSFNTHSMDEETDLTPKESHHMVLFNKGTHEITAIQFFDDNNMLVEENADGDIVSARAPEEAEDRVLILNMTGPVTRCGGWCSQGSMDYRDIMLEYAADDSVKGLVLVTDTPGGTAFALHDFEQGMEAWDAAGKNSIQWIDGMSLSAGVACGSQCQKVIAYNSHDVVGCIGAMMAGWATADGTIDSDGNRYIDVTATQTPDKNGEYRAAAAGDYKGLQKEVDNCCNEFLRIIDKCRPQITPEQRKGNTYNAGSVIGTLIDGIGSFDDAIHYALTGEINWNETPSDPIPSSASLEPEESEDPEEDPNHNPDEDPDYDPDHNPDEDPDYNPDEDPNNRCDPEKNNEAFALLNQIKQTVNISDMNLIDRLNAFLGIENEEEHSTNEQETHETQEVLESENTSETQESEATSETHETQEVLESENTSEPQESEATSETQETQESESASETQNTEESLVSTESQETSSDYAITEQTISQMATQIADYNMQINDLLAERDSARSLLSESSSTIDALTKQSSKFQELYEQEKENSEQANARILELENQLKNAREELSILQDSAPDAPQPAPAPHAQVRKASAIFSEDMTPEQKLNAYRQRGEQLKKQK